MLREIGLVVLSIHPIGQEDATILRRTRGVSGPLCSPHRFTTIVLASHKDIILHYSQSSVTLSILSHCSSITQRCNAAHWHSNRDIGVHLGQGAQGPPQALRGPRAPHSITPLLWGYYFYRNMIRQYSDDYVQYTLYIPDNEFAYKSRLQVH